MSKVTGGVYTPVRTPGDIVALLSGVSFANVEDVVAEGERRIAALAPQSAGDIRQAGSTMVCFSKAIVPAA